MLWFRNSSVFSLVGRGLFAGIEPAFGVKPVKTDSYRDGYWAVIFAEFVSGDVLHGLSDSRLRSGGI
jgi:hypothetical protein